MVIDDIKSLCDFKIYTRLHISLLQQQQQQGEDDTLSPSFPADILYDSSSSRSVIDALSELC